MTEVIWKYSAAIDCCRCDNDFLLFNQFGFCADCWGDMDEAERAVFTGDAADLPPKREVVTYRIPATPGVLRRFVGGVLGNAVGTGLALMAARWMRWL